VNRIAQGASAASPEPARHSPEAKPLADGRERWLAGTSKYGVTALPGGFLFEIQPCLRPGGRKGPWPCSLDPDSLLRGFPGFAFLRKWLKTLDFFQALAYYISNLFF
jgi:hypothetical protein